MKKFFILAIISVIIYGCSNNSAGAVKDKSFAQQYAELEKSPPQPTETGTSTILQSSADREADVAIEAQSERRAQPPLVESNYFFRIMPDKGVYSYDEYNQVWSDMPKDKDYKTEKRLWNKPKRHKGDSDGSSGGSGGSSARPISDDEAFYEEEPYEEE
ncbi:MAG: hypothetical protein LBG46_03835 [Elusimicrobiota bacterium]|jgi:hypothetical protein|nr:hypothetical protein [Elusimicrobiota bacterium]